MNFAKVTLALFVIVLAYLALAESRHISESVRRADYRFYQRERQPRHQYGYGRQYRADSDNTDREQFDKDGNDDKDIDDFEEIDDELNNLDLDDAGRILALLQNKFTTTTTQAPTATTVTTPTTTPTTTTPTVTPTTTTPTSPTTTS